MDVPAQSGLHWIKANKSIGAAACVELARTGEMVALRDSKNPETVLMYSLREIDAFIDGAKRGEFDRLIGQA